MLSDTLSMENQTGISNTTQYFLHSPTMENITGIANSSSLANTSSLQVFIPGLFAPLEYAHSILPSPKLDFIIRCMTFTLVAPFGFVANILSIFVLLKGKLVKSWTFGMILNLSITDLLMCGHIVICYTPWFFLGRLVQLLLSESSL